jgi:hypothetical protein
MCMENYIIIKCCLLVIVFVIPILVRVTWTLHY